MRGSQRSWIYRLFLCSGISGLVYETVWLRVISRVLGSTVYATAVVLAAYMAGLALGSIIVGRWAANRRDLLRSYALLELGVGLAALLLTIALRHLVPLYRVLFDLCGGSRAGLTVIQSAVMFLLLLVPTMLMGGTLPVLVGFTNADGRNIGDRMGLLYGLNTLGAVSGVLFAGMYAIGAIGEWRTVCIGIIINLLVALAAWVWAAQRRDAGGTVAAPATTAAAGASHPARRGAILLAYGCSGFIAISYEVIWTRMFQVQLGTSIYSFSMMLAYYLLGIAAGSLAGARWPLLSRRPWTVFAAAQALIALFGLSGMFLFMMFNPDSCYPTLRLGNMLLMPLLLVTPLTFLLGAILPAVGRIYVAGESTAAADVGRLYAANTAGCIAGSLCTGFVLIGWLGTRGSMIALSAANLALAWLVAGLPGWPGRRALRFAALAAASVALIAMAATVPDPFLSALFKSMRIQWGVGREQITLYAHYESAAATTTAFAVGPNEDEKQLWVNGIGMTKLCTETKIMAHLPLLLHPDPRHALVICLGMGTALRSAWRHRDVAVDVVEIVPDAYRCFQYFYRDAPRVLADPRIRHFADDGRNFLLMHDWKYDVITLDPAPPLYSAGTVNLYTTEFFRLCRADLRPGGILCLWIPPDHFTEVRMIMASFARVFPQTLVWGGPHYRGLYLTGFNGPVAVHPERFAAADRDTALVNDLTELDRLVPLPSAMLGLLVLDGPTFQTFVAGSPAVSDDLPYTEFPLWRSRSDPSYHWELNALNLAAWRDGHQGRE